MTYLFRINLVFSDSPRYNTKSTPRPQYTASRQLSGKFNVIRVNVTLVVFLGIYLVHCTCMASSQAFSVKVSETTRYDSFSYQMCMDGLDFQLNNICLNLKEESLSTLIFYDPFTFLGNCFGAFPEALLLLGNISEICWQRTLELYLRVVSGK